jgi:hypothetical protein
MDKTGVRFSLPAPIGRPQRRVAGVAVDGEWEKQWRAIHAE